VATRSYTGNDYDSGYGDVDRTSGWIGFAGTLLILGGAWNIFDGILAIANSKVYTRNSSYVFSDLRTWGWIMLVGGVLEALAGFAIFRGNQLARWFGIAAASGNGLIQLAFVPVYPFWGLMMFSIDVLIVYGLAVYGSRSRFAT
jgi:hypothetical protein